MYPRSGFGTGEHPNVASFWLVLGNIRQNHPFGSHSFSGKEKHIKINAFAGFSRDWVGGKILFMCFFLGGGGSFVVGEKKHINKIPPKIPGQSRENFVYGFFLYVFFGGTDMTGRPGDRTMGMNGRSTASYLAHALCVPVFLLVIIGLDAKGRLDFQGRRGITSVVRWNLARSYS